MPKTQSLKEDASKYQSIQLKQTNTLKACEVGSVLHGPAGLVVFSYGIRLTHLESMTDSCFLAKVVKETKHWFCLVQKSVYSGKVPVLAVCSYLVLSGPQ